MSLLFLPNLISTTHTSRQAGTRTLSFTHHTYSYLQTHTFTQHCIETHARSRVVDTHRRSLYPHPTPEPFHSLLPTAVSVQRIKYQYKDSSTQEQNHPTHLLIQNTTHYCLSLSTTHSYSHLVHKPLLAHRTLISATHSPAHAPIRPYQAMNLIHKYWSEQDSTPTHSPPTHSALHIEPWTTYAVATYTALHERARAIVISISDSLLPPHPFTPRTIYP